MWKILTHVYKIYTVKGNQATLVSHFWEKQEKKKNGKQLN